MEKIDFHQWLNEEMQRKGVNQSELARRGGISQSQVSRVVAAGRMPGPEFCAAAAKALNLPPEEVFRAAGLLPPKPDKTEELIERAQHLIGAFQYPETHTKALEYLQFLKDQEEKEVRARTVRKPAGAE